MAVVYRCDRCRVVSDMGLPPTHGDPDGEPPDGWHVYEMPVRGSEGRRDFSDALLCETCEDQLYDWLHDVNWEATDG